MTNNLYLAPAEWFPERSWKVQYGYCDCLECSRTDTVSVSTQYDGRTPEGLPVRVMVSHHGFHISVFPHPQKPPKAVDCKEAYAQLQKILSNSFVTSPSNAYTIRHNLDLS